MILEHVNLTVSDLQRSIDFYCRLLDLQVRWRTEPTEEEQQAHIGDERMYLALFQAPQPGRAWPSSITTASGSTTSDSSSRIWWPAAGDWPNCRSPPTTRPSTNLDAGSTSTTPTESRSNWWSTRPQE